MSPHARRSLLSLYGSEHGKMGTARSLDTLRRHGYLAHDSQELTDEGRAEAARLHAFYAGGGAVTVLTTAWPRDLIRLADDLECVAAGVGGEAFFPEDGASPRAAKRLCEACPMRRACYEYALPISDLYGVWAGTTQAEREGIRQGRRGAPAWYREALAA